MEEEVLIVISSCEEQGCESSDGRREASGRTLMIFFRTVAAVWVTRDLLFMGVSPLLRGVLGDATGASNVWTIAS